MTITDAFVIHSVRPSHTCTTHSQHYHRNRQHISSSKQSRVIGITYINAITTEIIAANANNNPNPIMNVIRSIIEMMKRFVSMIAMKITNAFDIVVSNRRSNATKEDNEIETIDSVMAMVAEERDLTSATVNASDDALISVSIVTSEIFNNPNKQTTISVPSGEAKEWAEKKIEEIEALEMKTLQTMIDSSGNNNIISSNIVPSSSPSLSLPLVDAVDVSVDEPTGMERIKSAGAAGIISYIFTELGFWAIMTPIILTTYHNTNNVWLDFANPDDRVKIFTLTGMYVTGIRLAVPIRLGVALACVPMIEKNIVKKYINKN